MFSYTDDAIVTSSPTGRHLSTVIRRPAAIGPLDWNEHADQVCKVLNELDSKVKAGSLSLHMRTEARQPMPSADPQREENLALRRKLDDATTKLCAAQMLLEKPVRLTADDVLRVLNLQTDTAVEVDGRTLARVE